MDKKIDLASICRICLESVGELNIWHDKIALPPLSEHKWHQDGKEKDTNDGSDEGTDGNVRLDLKEILQVLGKTEDSMLLAKEIPLICTGCSQILVEAYHVLKRMERSDAKLWEIYHETQPIPDNEDYLVEQLIVEEKEEQVEEDTLNYRKRKRERDPTVKHISRKAIEEGSLVISSFVPSTRELSPRLLGSGAPEKANSSPNSVLTLEYGAMKVKNSQIESIVNNDAKLSCYRSRSQEYPENHPVFSCNYCSHSFTDAIFLKTHLKRCHMCKYCTRAFPGCTELFAHIREQHKDQTCAVCHKKFSSSSNLRKHIKQMHGVMLPPEVSLLAFHPPEGNEQIKLDSPKEKIVKRAKKGISSGGTTGNRETSFEIEILEVDEGLLMVPQQQEQNS